MPATADLPVWSQEHEAMLEGCFDREDDLTQWERDFVDALDCRLGKDMTPTRKQTAVLERIWARLSE